MIENLGNFRLKILGIGEIFVYLRLVILLIMKKLMILLLLAMPIGLRAESGVPELGLLLGKGVKGLYGFHL